MCHHGRRWEQGGLPTLDAVAIDLGATSIRFAHGRLVEGKIEFEIVKQVANQPKGRCWDIDLLVGFCREAVEFAKTKNASVGIDSWGVDHGFLDHDGNLIGSPIMYRDPTHSEQFEAFEPRRGELFALTGIAHQPFNTLYQLAARSKEDPTLPSRANWHLTPDLISYLLTGVRHHEQTQASTTQLMGLDGQWSQEAFDMVGWPMPELQPRRCGHVIGTCDATPVVSVASHDTGSAVAGVGELVPGDAYLNLGTWALLGVQLPEPNTSVVAAKGNWTNEWSLDGTIRFLKNIPGFFVINRLHAELGIKASIGDWLESRDFSFTGRFDQQSQLLYNPSDMVSAVASICDRAPSDNQEWAQCALMSLIECIASDLPSLRQIAGPLKRLRVVGGGSKSLEFCNALADYAGLEIAAGPVEATVLGNLAVQFAATGETDIADARSLVSRSLHLRVIQPQGEQCASN